MPIKKPRSTGLFFIMNVGERTLADEIAPQAGYKVWCPYLEVVPCSVHGSINRRRTRLTARYNRESFVVLGNTVAAVFSYGYFSRVTIVFGVGCLGVLEIDPGHRLRAGIASGKALA